MRRDCSGQTAARAKTLEKEAWHWPWPGESDRRESCRHWQERAWVLLSSLLPQERWEAHEGTTQEKANRVIERSDFHFRDRTLASLQRKIFRETRRQQRRPRGLILMTLLHMALTPTWHCYLVVMHTEEGQASSGFPKLDPFWRDKNKKRERETQRNESFSS